MADPTLLAVSAMVCATALVIASLFHRAARKVVGEILGVLLALFFVLATVVGGAMLLVYVGARGLELLGWMP